MLFADISDPVALAIVGIFSLIVKEIFDHVRSRRTQQKIEENTAITKQGVAKIEEKVDSAGQDMKQQTAGVAVITKYNAKKAEEAAVLSQGAAEKLDERMGEIKEAIEQRQIAKTEIYERLDDHSNRIGDLEKEIHTMRTGQDSLTKKVDQILVILKADR